MTDRLAGEHDVVVDGKRQHFFVAGRGPHCIVHSGGPGIDAKYLRMPLLEEHLTMVYLDPIGTGQSDRLASHPAGYTVDFFSNQLLGFLDVTGIKNAYLLGHSHGAFVTLQAALSRSTDLTGLIVYAGAAYTGGAFMRDAGANIASFVNRNELTSEADGVKEAWAAIPRIQSDSDYTSALKGLLPAYFSDFRRSSTIIQRMQSNLIATLLIGDNKPFDVRDRLTQLEIPSLVIAGRDDFILGPQYAEDLAAKLSSTQFLILERSGHFAHLEEPESFADAVARFVEGTRRIGLS